MHSGNNQLANLGQSFAIILALIAILISFWPSAFRLGLVIGVIALTCALLSTENQPLTYKARASIILSIIGIVLGIVCSSYFDIIYGW